MWLFASCVHTSFLLAILGLAVTSVTIVLYTADLHELLGMTGLLQYRKTLAFYALAGLFLGLLLAWLYKRVAGLPLVQGLLTLSALVAPAIGMTEEIVFRGFIQGAAGKKSALLGITIAAASHSVYKLLVIASFPVSLNINLYYLVGFTFAGGLLFGWLRWKAINIIPAMLAHAIFDILIYGHLHALPVWVWG